MRIIAATLLTLVVAATADARPSGPDPGFGAHGIVLLGGTPTTGQHVRFYPAAGIAVQEDGKIVLAGSASGMTFGANPRSVNVPAVARFNADGSWDANFGDHGLFALSANAAAPAGGESSQVALLSDGSVVASGAAYSSGPFDYSTCILMFKLTGTGVMDTSFGGANGGSFCQYFSTDTTGSTPIPFTSLQVGSGDLIYVTSSRALTDANGGAIARYTSAGILDGSFGSSGIVTSQYSFGYICLQPDQRLVAVAAGGAVFFRFTSSGLPDPTFGSSGAFALDLQGFAPVYAGPMRLDEAGNIVATFMPRASSDPTTYLIARVTPDGRADATFNGNAQQPGFAGFASIAIPGSNDGFAADLDPLADGHILIVGTDVQKMNVVRIGSDASFDASFGDVATPGISDLSIASTTNHADATATNAQGRVLIAADFDGTNIGGACRALLRIIPDQLTADGFEGAATLPVCPP